MNLIGGRNTNDGAEPRPKAEPVNLGTKDSKKEAFTVMAPSEGDDLPF
jgi:hypothetical protein